MTPTSSRHEGPAALVLRDTVVNYGGFKAVNELSLTVRPGERWSVIGPNGAGKTSLFSAISGEVKVSSGTIELLGHDITTLPPKGRARRGIGRTYQITNIFPDLSVLESVTVAMMARHRNRWRAWWPLRIEGALAERAGEILRTVALESRSGAKASELSHGEQRQLELALAIANSPRLLLLDEPAAGLTAAERLVLTELILNLPRDISLLMIEHDMEMALTIADRILCMDNGAVIATGTPAEIRASEVVQSVYLGQA